MAHIYHLNCLKIVSPSAENVIGHCLLLQDDTGALALVDTGIGLLDTINPQERIGQDLIEMAGFAFHESLTAIKQLEKLGLNTMNVTDCILSHLDPDHAGGLADFPSATVHVSEEEYTNFYSGNPRYLLHQLNHQPLIRQYAHCTERWFGFEARKINANVQFEIYFIPLFGHTNGHCGVAVKHQNQWLFYVADAYYLQIELDGHSSHPVHELVQFNADNNNTRLQSLKRIRKFKKEHPEITIFCYHDEKEFPR